MLVLIALIAADFYKHRIQKFLPDGTLLTGSAAKGRGDDTAFAVDFGNNRVRKWRLLRQASGG